jgi:lipopolysaccharide transport protein LptA
VTQPRARAFVLLAGALLARGAAAVGPDLPPFGLGAFDRDEPITITAQELEAQDGEGTRTLAFRRGVQVRQGPLSLSADTLRAVYVSGESQPRELDASGNVRIDEGFRRARCEVAHYDRAGQSLECRGAPAQIWDRDDRLAGTLIAFDLERKTVRVDRGTEVEIHRQIDETDLAKLGPESAEMLERVRGKGPVQIRADSLFASDPGTTERRIHFGGGVALNQGGIGLQARELEAVYPPGATQPERLIARDDVVLSEGDREASCAFAEYHLAERRVACEGGAVLRDGEDRLEGGRIAFDYDAHKVDASGGARLSVRSLRRDREPAP